ncbi:SUN domain-containing protein [Haematococcus lacustris]|uniref:SUN domain-containing protein n=1 Tax=Haematococcus lacustris TaxID=44745 RepID=A0A6A0A083_HAELA|nr:SUN domain-containing protein [Haematococcus lacustris]
MDRLRGWQQQAGRQRQQQDQEDLANGLIRGDHKQLISSTRLADGATVVAANKEARKPEKTIDGDDDSFVRNACAAQKWIILELSQLGRVDEVELVMTEMYSSRVRDFSVKGRQSHPRKDGPSSDYPRFFDSESWQLLGDFTAANRKGAQLFKMPLRRRIRR